ncbi:MAG TPA: cupin domain-containing protein [Acidimicrobiales bacterium]|nr:cupin domain-containing protein [Acidimicrobiales bacterium]
MSPTATPLTPDTSQHPSTAALARCVGDVAAFVRCAWGRQPHQLPAADPQRFGDLLSLAAVDHILATTAPRTPSFRLVKDGTPLPPSSYTRSGTVGGVRYHGGADVARIYRAFSDGATIVLQSLHRSWAPLASFCRSLELFLSHPAQANAYLTPAGATALAPHHDTHDVFVLQVHGHKHWRISEPVIDSPLPRHRSRRELAAAQPVLFETDLTPGQCLYLPRGYVHAATSQEGTSLHVTIGIHAVTLHDILVAAVERAADEPTFRAALPLGFARDDGAKALVEAVGAGLAEGSRWFGGLDPTPLAAEARRRFWEQRPPLLEGQLQELDRLGDLHDASMVVRRPNSICQVDDTPSDAPSRLRLLLGDRVLVLPSAVEAAVRRLVAGPPLQVSALADLLDGPSRLVLVRRLVIEGVLQVRG